MSYQSVLSLIGACASASSRSSSLASAAEAFGRETLQPQWHDDVGRAATVSYRTLSGEWESALSMGFSAASDAAYGIRTAYENVHRAEEEAQRAYDAMESAWAECK